MPNRWEEKACNKVSEMLALAGASVRSGQNQGQNPGGSLRSLQP